ncbi:MATE family efflux transporter [Thiomicrorhabdus cannonii]|uniref:MATE family efflux transporter n=1 Tax=Thiomicrorhabdus cannonii TaxID=2748011 RepID=UPI0015B9ADAC|nr:MATE family efflux transporter [Thiomicrorhabdus cannonii]
MSAIPFSGKQLQSELRLLFKLALPIFFAQLALTALGFVDTIMSGWVGTDDLAAIGLGSNIMLPVFIFSTGVLLALTPLISKQEGAGNADAIRVYLQQGLWLALPLGAVSVLVMLNLDGLLRWLDLSPNVFQLTSDYLFYIAWGLPGIALYQALRFFWEGLGTTQATMWISFLALFFNIPLNALFIYGYGPVPALGAAGCGVASAIVMWLMFAAGLLYVFRSAVTRPFLHGWQSIAPRWQAGMNDILNLGIPNSLALLFEVSLFSFIALFIVKLGVEVIAGHQVAISFTSMVFMLPLSVAMAITVRVGKHYGAHNRAAMLLSLYAGLGAALVIGGSLSLLTYFFRHEIVGIYSSDDAVLAVAVTLLVYAAAYQVFDAIQVACAGALRGLHDTRVTMLVTFLSYWIIGLAGGYVLAYTDWLSAEPLGVSGFWLGIVIGLSLAAVLLAWRLKRQFNVHFG